MIPHVSLLSRCGLREALNVRFLQNGMINRHPGSGPQGDARLALVADG